MRRQTIYPPPPPPPPTVYLVGDECHLQDGDLQGVGEVPLQARLPQREEQSQGENKFGIMINLSGCLILQSMQDADGSVILGRSYVLHRKEVLCHLITSQHRTPDDNITTTDPR